MNWTYRCPHCKALLNPDENIILVGEHQGRRVLTGFHPRPGNYKIFFPPEVQLEDGQTWNFFCPVCQVDLKDKHNEEMCAIELEEELETSRVLFSRKSGQKATFILSDRVVLERHGQDSDEIFFNLSLMR